MALFPQHAQMLAESGISPECARARGYVTVDTKVRLERLGITAAGRRTPGLLVPMRRADGSEWGYQYRPDSPRERSGSPVKYETPTGQRNGIDVPPGVGERLANLEEPLFITEGTKKADSAAARGLCCIALPGVWSWKGKPGNDPHESTVAVGDWHDIGIKGRGVILAFDSDVMVKPSVRKALDQLTKYLVSRGAGEVRFLVLPDEGDGKTGLDDFLAAHPEEDVRTLLGPHVYKVMPEVQKGDTRQKGDAETVENKRMSPMSPMSPILQVMREPGAADRVLRDVETFIRRFCVLPGEHAYVAVTLWAAHTHFIGRMESTGRLACLSPEAGSGKTRVLEVLDTLCGNPLFALDLSMSAFFRIVDDRQPTILLDEVDAIFTGKSKSESTEDLRRVINNGYRPGAVVQRVGGQNRDEVHDFKVFCPVAMAGLGHLPDTLMTRSIVLRMRRRAPSERVQPWRDRLHRPEGEELQLRMAAWAQVAPATIEYPDLPEGVADRDADVWEPLLMVADMAGGEWPTRARAACLAFINDKPEGSVSLGVRLLMDLRKVWEDDEPVMATGEILARLAELEDAPWADLYGEGLQPRKLSRLLSDYEVRPKDVRTRSGTRKGYRREDLHDPWTRYLPTRSPQKGDKGDKGDTAGQSVADGRHDGRQEPLERATSADPVVPGTTGNHPGTTGVEPSNPHPDYADFQRFMAELDEAES